MGTVGRLHWELGDGATEADGVAAWSDLLRAAGWDVGVGGSPVDVPDVTLVCAAGGLPEDRAAALAEQAAGGRPVLLVGGAVDGGLPRLGAALGLLTGSWTPAHPSRVTPAADGSAWSASVSPLGEPIEVSTPVLVTDKVSDPVEVWLTAPIGLAQHPVATWNPETSVGAFTVWPSSEPGTAQQAARLLHLVLRRLLSFDAAPPRPIGVGLLAFGAIGAEHARAVSALPQLELRVVCDRSDLRLEVARASFPEARTTSDAATLVDDPTVELVVVSTPPDTHADWAIRCLEAGKDVVVEKPFALSVDEADRVLSAARRSGRRAVVYQNRRFDPDFLAVRDAVTSGSIGEVFHLETFIGGYGHPCNYWHSDEGVSGGAVYDWGSHVIDQLLTLHDSSIDHVTAVEHKRRWHDVTNADHTTVTLRFVDGTEASFLHSDLAAAMKPRWYVLGTDGALTSSWRQTSVTRRNDVGTLDEDVLAVTDAPPDVVRHDPDGSQTVLARRSPPQHAFHRELVDDLLSGWPMQVRAEQSRRVVAVMEAARSSARHGGRPVSVDGEQ